MPQKFHLHTGVLGIHGFDIKLFRPNDLHFLLPIIRFLYKCIMKKGGMPMKIIITGKNLEVSEGLKNAVEEKIGKRFFFTTPSLSAMLSAL